MLKELSNKAVALLSWFLGGVDDLILALSVFIIVDLLFSILLYFIKKNIKTFINKKTLCKKFAMFFIIGLSNIIDIYLVDFISCFRTITILFYIVYETRSILEKTIKLGLPIPKPLLVFIENLNSENNKTNN